MTASQVVRSAHLHGDNAGVLVAIQIEHQLELPVRHPIHALVPAAALSTTAPTRLTQNSATFIVDGGQNSKLHLDM